MWVASFFMRLGYYGRIQAKPPKGRFRKTPNRITTAAPDHSQVPLIDGKNGCPWE